MPCPSHPEPLAGRMPLTAWHDAHASCTTDYEEERTGGGMAAERGEGTMVSGVVSREQCCCGGWHVILFASFDYGAALTVCPLTTRPPKSTCEPWMPVSTT